jgi:hypothetical protein
MEKYLDSIPGPILFLVCLGILWWVSGPNSWPSRLRRKGEARLLAFRQMSIRQHEEQIARNINDMSIIALDAVEDVVNIWVVQSKLKVPMSKFKETFSGFPNLCIGEKGDMVIVMFMSEGILIDSRQFPIGDFDLTR